MSKVNEEKEEKVKDLKEMIDEAKGEQAEGENIKSKKPAADEKDKKSDDKKSDEKKSDEKKSDEKKSDEKKSDEKKSDEEEAGTEVPADFKLPGNPVLYAGIGIAVIAVLLLLLGKKCKSASNKRSNADVNVNGAKMNEAKETGKAVLPITEIQNAEEETSITERNVADMQEKEVANIASVHEQGSREDQQDSFGVEEDGKGTFLVVADGMGGLNNGGQISTLAVNVARDIYCQFSIYENPADMLLKIANYANYHTNQFLRGKQRGGSTLVTACIRDGFLYFLTIGDSRIYLYRSGALIQLNREHVYKEELALAAVNGNMDIQNIHSDPQAEALTSYLGAPRIEHLDRNASGMRLLDGDKIMLASDGVFGSLLPEQMENALKFPVEEAAKKIRDMVKEVDKVHQDNYTALIYEYKQ